MKTITIADIRSWKPCYDHGKYLPEDWSGTALDILRMDNVPARDRLWAALRNEVLDKKTLRLLAVRYVRETPIGDGRHVVDLLTDKRSIRALEVAERFARGMATRVELQVARDAAWAARDAALAARATAGAAARAAARAAWADAWAAWAAAGDAAWATAGAAAGDAAWAAGDAQIQITIDQLTKENNVDTVEDVPS